VPLPGRSFRILECAMPRRRLVVSVLLVVSFVSALRFTDANDSNPQFSLVDLGIVLSTGCFFIFFAALVLDTILTPTPNGASLGGS